MEHNSKDSETLQDVINQAVNDHEIPKIYFNGFSNSLSNSDILTVLITNGKPTAVINTSLTSAKSFAIKLLELVSILEESSGNTIMTTDEVNISLSKQRKPKVK